MNKLFSFLKNNLTIFILFLVWLPITFFNTKIYWMLVDDGWDVIFSRTLFEKLSSLNLTGFVSQLMESGGRFRPVYWTYHMWVWLIGGNSYQFQHFVHMLVIGLTVLFVYLIIKELTKSKSISLFAALFYLLTPLNTENIFRLGPQEPLLAMFLGILFYLAIKNRKIFLPCLVLVLAIFTKETSVALLPVLLFYYIYSKKGRLIKNKKQSFYLWTTVCVSSLALILITFLRRGGYSSNYNFDIIMWMDTLLIYIKELSNNTLYIFPLFFIIYLIRNGIGLFKKQKIIATKLDLFEFLFFVGFLCFLFIQIPWKYALTRYLMPTIFFLTVFSFVEIYQNLKLIYKFKIVSNRTGMFTFLAILLGFYVFSIWGVDVVFKEMSGISTYDVFKKMASYPRNTVLLMNMKRGESTIELVDEIQIHLSEFWNRGDIKSQYLDLQNLPKNNYVIVDSDQFPRAYSQEELNSLYKNKYTSINKTSRRPVITTSLEIIKQTLKKLANLVIYKKEFTTEGIYTYYYNYNNWSFYNE